MRYLILVICLVSFLCNVYANSAESRIRKMPEGTFKKSFTGKIIQYDKNGKKIGSYKLKNGRYYKIK